MRYALPLAALVAAFLALAYIALDEEDAPRRARGPAATTGAGAATPKPPARRPRLPLRRAAGRLVVLRFNGPSLPDYVRRSLRAGRSTGVILFKDNVVSPAQLRALTAAVRRAGGRRALVMTDQEGGEVRIVPFAGPERSPSAQAAAGAVRADSRAAARELRALGVGITLAPVADLAAPGSALRGRGFGNDPAGAARGIRQAVRGFTEGGVLPTLKHFPGLGTATANTDDAQVSVAGRPPLDAFAAGIDAGAPLVMLSHAAYPDLDPSGRIASQSRAIATTLLRGELGFDGVAITDSMEAEAVISRARVDVAAERAVRAGADLILTTGQGSSLPVYRRLLRSARRSPAFAARVREAAARVDRLRRRVAG
ncbi:MAG TPA: glycoside hydrolase family 3 N-terminal domain-containing protein [Solirubrobacteraceae bacterium]|jgi:beta-N-acetylhexosaminidase